MVYLSSSLSVQSAVARIDLSRITWGVSSSSVVRSLANLATGDIVGRYLSSVFRICIHSYEENVLAWSYFIRSQFQIHDAFR